MLEFYYFFAQKDGQWLCFLPNEDGMKVLTEGYGLTSRFDPFKDSENESFWRDMFAQAEEKGFVPAINRFAPFEMQEQRCLMRAEAICHQQKLPARQYKAFMDSVYDKIAYMVANSYHYTISHNEAAYTGLEEKPGEGYCYPEALDVWSYEPISEGDQGFSYTNFTSDFAKAYQLVVNDKLTNQVPLTRFDQQVLDFATVQ